MDATNPITTTAHAPRASRVRSSRRVADRILIVASTLATLLGIIVLGSILLIGCAIILIARRRAESLK